MTPTDITPPEDHEPRIVVLSEAQIDAIAQRVEDRMLIRIGRKVVDKVLWAIGLCALAIAVWLSAKGVKQ